MNIAGIPLKSTADHKTSSLFMAIWGQPKSGKTTIASTLDKLTQEQAGKRTVIVGCEQADGNGLDNITDLDIPTLVVEATADSQAQAAKAFQQLSGVFRELKDNNDFGGIIWDGASEAMRHIVIPYITANFHPTKKKEDKELRTFGVLTDKDYIYISEILRHIMLDLAIANERGKHVIITTGVREFKDQIDNGQGGKERAITKIGVDFPGREAPKMFETMVPTIGEATLEYVGTGADRHLETFLNFAPDRIRTRGDRRSKFPLTGKLPGNIYELYNKYYAV